MEARTSKTEDERDGDPVTDRERSESGSARSFTRPGEFDQSKSSAKPENRVLTLELAKRRASTGPQLAVS